jgi:pimeloyl-ACP methyl ester carboxylesterase
VTASDKAVDLSTGVTLRYVEQGAGHVVHWERPAEVAEDVAAFALQQRAD